jgi:hypothetical protein
MCNIVTLRIISQNLQAISLQQISRLNCDGLHLAAVQMYLLTRSSSASLLSKESE